MGKHRSKEEKLIKRFYEVLVLLRVLGQVQGDKINRQTLGDADIHSMTAVEMRRMVMNHLCTMCDFLKGGDTVTAMAVENLPQGPRYWVAAHGQLKKIVAFLSRVLGMLGSWTSADDQLDLEGRLFDIFVEFHRPRIAKYLGVLRGSIENELNRIELDADTKGAASDYEQWLRTFHGRPESLQGYLDISRLAYKSRHSEFVKSNFDPLHRRYRVESRSREYIHHYIGRLAAPMRAAKFLSHAASNYPFMFDGYALEFLDSGTPSCRPSEDDHLTLDGISKRMFKADAPELTRFREALQSLENTGSIMDRILDQYRDKNWKPRVHAELVLLEAIHGSNFSFVDDDKYIACSKPSCFCCYHYIYHHPGQFARPPSHNKVYLNWQPPNCTGIRPCDGLDHQREVMVQVTERVRKAVTERVLGGNRDVRWHPDSTTGITPIRDVDVERSDSASPDGSEFDDDPSVDPSISAVWSSEHGDDESRVDSLIAVWSSENEDDEEGGVPLSFGSEQ